jgi:hypothetical protein
MGFNGCGVSNRMGGRITNGPVVGHWVAERLNSGFFEDRSRAIGLVKDERIVAGVIFENWNGRSLVAHMVAEGRLTRKFISAIFDYAFNVCDVFKIICPVSSANLKSCRLVENMGFCEEGRLKDAVPDGDNILYTMTKPGCRFLGERYGQK